MLRLILVLVLVLTSCTFTETATAAADEVFDSFEGPAGSMPDPKLWDYDLGGGWGHGSELQEYTNSADNVRLDGRGNLVIEAHKTPAGYTSGRLVTHGKLDMLYGTVSARIKFPSGQGVWSTFWAMGSNIDNVGWPRCGEIDIMELVNTGTRYNVTLHGPQGDSDYLSGAGVARTGEIADLSEDFHVYWMHWKRDEVIVGVDETTLADFTPSSLPPGGVWAFNHPMSAILSLAIGGTLAGPPTDTTPFPVTMLVDWFRYSPSG